MIFQQEFLTKNFHNKQAKICISRFLLLLIHTSLYFLNNKIIADVMSEAVMVDTR